jgi:hypothetical protein
MVCQQERDQESYRNSKLGTASTGEEDLRFFDLPVTSHTKSTAIWNVLRRSEQPKPKTQSRRLPSKTGIHKGLKISVM